MKLPSNNDKEIFSSGELHNSKLPNGGLGNGAFSGGGSLNGNPHNEELYGEFYGEFTVRNDFAFKHVFGSEASKEILPEFLSLVTGIDPNAFAEIRIENPSLPPEYSQSKFGILDLKLTLHSGQRINIELQNYWSSHFPKRSLYYWAKLYTEEISTGEKYDNLNQCISINIINDKFPLSEKTHSVYRLLEKEEHTLLDGVLEIHFLDLSKAEKEESLGLLRDWLLFIRTNNRREREKMANRSDALARANELMEQFYSDPEARKQYEAVQKYKKDQWMFEEEYTRRGKEQGLREGLEMGLLQGIEKGMEQGSMQEKLRIAESLKEMGASSEMIRKATGLEL